MKNTPENVATVAKEFNKILLRWYKAHGAYSEDRSERVEVKNLTARLVSEANDHFDANMAMDEAMRKNGLDPFDDSDGGMSQDATDLFNNAWDEAVKIAEAPRPVKKRRT